MAKKKKSYDVVCVTRCSGFFELMNHFEDKKLAEANCRHRNAMNANVSQRYFEVRQVSS